MCQQPPRRGRHGRTIRPLEQWQGRNGADVVGDEIRAGVNRGDAGHGQCGAGIDCPDLRVSMRGAQHVKPQRILPGLVVDEVSFSCQKPLVFETLDGLTRAEAQIGRQNVHRWSFKPDFRATPGRRARHSYRFA